MSTDQPRKSLAAIDPLTGVRGFAAIWVVVYHFRHPLTDLLSLSGQSKAFVGSGFLGVDLFAVLSGFVISLAYSTRLKRLSLRASGRFLWLRLARIYPLLLFMLAMFVVSYLWRSGPGGWTRVWTDESFWLQALMLNGWGLETRFAWNIPSWTVSSEWLCYLLFPIAAPLLVRVRSGPLAATLAGATILATAIAMSALGHPYFGATLEWGFLRIAGEFLTGCWLYRAYQAGLGRHLSWGPIGTVALCIGLYACSVGGHPITVFSFVILVYALAHRGQPLEWVFGNRVSLYLGEISYSVYLIHWFVRADARILLETHVPSLSPNIQTPLLLALVFLLASITHYAVERPARSSMRRLIDAGSRT
jgi:peptidoglycan/LPS O-acetylase OafA/YrhL